MKEVLDHIVKEEVRRLITDEKVRPDGRGIDEIRPLSSEVGILPRTHGSGYSHVDKHKPYHLYIRSFK